MWGHGRDRMGTGTLGTGLEWGHEDRNTWTVRLETDTGTGWGQEHWERDGAHPIVQRLRTPLGL